jgi:hypothetical protein
LVDNRYTPLLSVLGSTVKKTQRRIVKMTELEELVRKVQLYEKALHKIVESSGYLNKSPQEGRRVSELYCGHTAWRALVRAKMIVMEDQIDCPFAVSDEEPKQTCMDDYPEYLP